MGDKGGPHDQGDQGKGGPETAAAGNPVDETKLSQEQAEQSARTIGGYIRDFLARLSLTDWITAIGTAVIAAATIWNVFVVTGQLAEMHNGGVDTHNLAIATQNLAAYAHDQARATADLKDITTKQVAALTGQETAAITGNALAKAANRPWIGASFFQADPPTKADTPLKITIGVTNAGRTPAHMTALLGQMNVFGAFPANPPYSGPVDEISRSVIVPGQNLTLGFDTNPLSQSQLDAINGLRAHLYIYAVAVYSDIGGRTNHQTHLCFWWVPHLQRYGNCPSYNDAN